MSGVFNSRTFLFAALIFVPLHLYAECGDRVCDAGEDTYNCAYDCGLVVDHHAVLQFNEIPDEWITKAKEFTIHYAHASHGDQINDGLLWLEGEDSKYSFAIRRDSSTADLPSAENPPEIRMFSGNPPNDPMSIGPSQYYNSGSGLQSTRDVADTGNFNFSMFSWCSQMCYFTLDDMDAYNLAMDNFETEYPNMRFIYMTGTWAGNFHANCMDEDPSVEIAKVNAMNQRIKDYAIANHKILYDFRDIETHDPEGTEHQETPDKCSWCDEWCTSHPSDCVSLPSSCDHSRYADYPEGALICILKGKAFWWMMARLAGWGGGEGDDGGPDIDDGNNNSSAGGGCAINSNCLKKKFYLSFILFFFSAMLLGLYRARSLKKI